MYWQRIVKTPNTDKTENTASTHNVMNRENSNSISSFQFPNNYIGSARLAPRADRQAMLGRARLCSAPRRATARTRINVYG